MEELEKELAFYKQKEQELRLRVEELNKDLTRLVNEEQQKNQLLTELEQSEARLRMAMDSTMLGTWDYNPVSGRLIWSDECKKIYGLAPDEEVEFSLFAEHIHPDDREFVEAAIQQAMHPADGGNYRISYRILRFGSHEVRWVKSFGKVYFDDKGSAVRFFGTVLDITDVKKAEEMSGKLAAIVQSSDDAIISKTLEGIITSWNNAAHRMFGYTADEIIGKSVLILIPEERHQEEPLIIDRIKKGEHVEHFETKRITKDKKIIDLSLTISPVKDTNGHIIGVSKIARDITSKKQEEIRKNDFIAIVSHELKTPLTSIKSYIQVLLAKARKQDNDFTLHALSRAEMHTNKMTLMINDFLSLARLEEGKIYLNKESFELHPLMEEIANDAQFLAAGHTIKLHDCEHIVVNADKDKISQILINLLSNAIKYSPKGSTVIIGCKKNGDRVKVYVTDEGVGINKNDQERLFERFYRVENEKMKSVSGFGIGLYLVAEILKFHDSKIEVESEVGKGSTFWFELRSED